jgi:hypothetical protein
MYVCVSIYTPVQYWFVSIVLCNTYYTQHHTMYIHSTLIPPCRQRHQHLNINPSTLHLTV